MNTESLKRQMLLKALEGFGDHIKILREHLRGAQYISVRIQTNSSTAAGRK